MAVIAYHIVWTTYGTWLPGDRRGWIKKNTVGIQHPDPQRQEQARKRMVEQAVFMTDAQRALVERTIREHCRIRQWLHHAVNVLSNHVHVVVTADRDGDEVMKQFKAWCSRALSDSAGAMNAVAVHAGRRRWFTEGGKQKIIKDDTYLENVIRYVLEGQ